MSCFSINRLCGHCLFTGAIFLLCLLQSCQSKDKPDKLPEDISNRKFHRINLFSEERITEHNDTGKLSFDQAYESSKYVLFAAGIIKIDSSDTRGVHPFYIYKVNKGLVEKPADTNKLKFPVYFMSNESLFKGQSINDSVYLFLSPLEDYHILRKNTAVECKWVRDAPFIKR